MLLHHLSEHRNIKITSFHSNAALLRCHVTHKIQCLRCFSVTKLAVSVDCPLAIQQTVKLFPVCDHIHIWKKFRKLSSQSGNMLAWSYCVVELRSASSTFTGFTCLVAYAVVVLYQLWRVSASWRSPTVVTLTLLFNDWTEQSLKAGRSRSVALCSC